MTFITSNQIVQMDMEAQAIHYIQVYEGVNSHTQIYTVIKPIFHNIYVTVTGRTSAVHRGQEPSPVCERKGTLVS